MSENIAEAARASDARTAARQTLAFMALAYAFCVAWIFSSMLYVLGPAPVQIRSDFEYLLAFYLTFALVIIPHAWYVYGGIKRKRGSKGPNVVVGVIIPTVVGYIVFVLVTFFEVYDSRALIGLASSFRFLVLLEPAYIVFFYLFNIQGREKGSKPSRETEQ